MNKRKPRSRSKRIRRRKTMIPDSRILAAHRQLDAFSCIPMTVELVLKLLHKVAPNYFDLQTQWNNSRDRDFSFFDQKTIRGVKFRREFWHPRDDNFPINQLFAKIESELKVGRYVIIALQVPGGWHNYVVYNRLPNGDFEAVTKGQSPK